jgi:hypothetical protein
MACKKVRPTTTSGCLVLGSMYMHWRWHLCLGICVPFLKIHVLTLGFVPFFLGSMYFINIHVTTLGSVTMHWMMTWTPHHHHVPHGPLLEGPLSFSDIYSCMCGLLCFIDHMCWVVKVVGVSYEVARGCYEVILVGCDSICPLIDGAPSLLYHTFHLLLKLFIRCTIHVATWRHPPLGCTSP